MPCAKLSEGRSAVQLCDSTAGRRTCILGRWWIVDGVRKISNSTLMPPNGASQGGGTTTRDVR